ncbi:MAG: hypothetical protein IJ802_06180 [Kiritimatiellae bacterium]|nr:hypothetical protein [Kiritimatiellia bacterium]
MIDSLKARLAGKSPLYLAMTRIMARFACLQLLARRTIFFKYSVYPNEPHPE